jgi:hypothetical protein
MRRLLKILGIALAVLIGLPILLNDGGMRLLPSDFAVPLGNSRLVTCSGVARFAANGRPACDVPRRDGLVAER